MKIVVIGGTGLIGSKLVHALDEHGHEAVAAAPSTGVNTLTGEGLPEVLAGASVVVDVSNSPQLDDSAIEFFRTATTNLLTAEKNAGVRHHVALSVVGTAQLAPQSGYFQAKLLQENLIAEGPIPYTLVHATQFFEFVRTLADSATVDGTVRMPPAYFQPMAAADVARAVADVSAGPPLRGTREVAGPEVFALDELGRITLAARGDDRKVVTDATAGMFAAVPGDALIARGDAVIATTTYRDWLNRRRG